jgi:hypothetical protein
VSYSTTAPPEVGPVVRGLESLSGRLRATARDLGLRYVVEFVDGRPARYIPIE